MKLWMAFNKFLDWIEGEETLKKLIKRVEVKSLANGDFVVVPEYRDKPLEKGGTVHGILTRMSIAKKIARALNNEIK